MKKLKLKALALSSAELLSSDQLKSTLRSATGGDWETVYCSCQGGGGGYMACSSTQECADICLIICRG